MKALYSRRVAAMIFPALLVLILMGCSGPTTVPPTPTLSSIAVTPANPSISVNATEQFKATGTYSDASTKDITGQVTWKSATTTVATISAGGLATPVAASAGGSSVITATLGTVSGMTTLTVTVPTLVSISVTPANPSIALGATQQFTATGTYSDNSMKDLTAQVTWASATMGVATISAGGLATSVSAGTSVITATDGTVSGMTTLTVTAAVLVSIKITPANPTIAAGTTVDFTGVGLLSDGTTMNVTPITWTSGTPATASTISTSGISRGLAVGTSTITASGGGVTGTTLLTVVAAASRFAYVANANGGDGTISIYAVNPANPTNGTFSPRGVVQDPGFAEQAIPEPSGKYVYVLNGNNTIGIYNVDPIGGGLTASSIPPVSNGGVFPFEGVVDPTGRFLYAANAFANTVTGFAIDPSTGNLTGVPNSPYTVGTTPAAVITDRSGKFLYLVNQGDNQIAGYTIDQTTGSLSVLSPTPTFPTGMSPQFPVIDQQNQFLYVPGTADDTVTAFSINSANGLLTPVLNSPFHIGPGAPNPNSPASLAVDPSGNHLYVANTNTDTVAGFAVSGGAVGAAVAGSPYSTSPTGAPIGAFPFSVTVDPGGAYVAVVNSGSNDVALFSLNVGTGALTPNGTVEARSLPQFVNLYIAPASPVIAPADAFASNSNSATTGDISAYTAMGSTGALTAAAGAPATGVGGNALSATDLSGQHFYTAGTTATGNELAAFSITQSTAALTDLSGSPFLLGTAIPSSVVVHPSGDPTVEFVYVAGTGGAGSILGFSLNTTTNSLDPIPGTPLAVSNLNAIVMDPQGQSVYALGSGFLQPVGISPGNGQLAASSMLTAAGTWISGAVDASGQYLLALDSAGKQIQAFSVGILSTFAPIPSGPVATGLTSPSALTLDALNRFVFVTDTTANTITTFSFTPSTGVVALPAVATTTLAGTPGQMALDATGTYLYVAVLGTPATNPGSVAAFKIGSNGALTAVAAPYPAGTGTAGLAVANSIK